MRGKKITKQQGGRRGKRSVSFFFVSSVPTGRYRSSRPERLVVSLSVPKKRGGGKKRIDTQGEKKRKDRKKIKNNNKKKLI